MTFSRVCSGRGLLDGGGAWGVWSLQEKQAESEFGERIRFDVLPRFPSDAAGGAVTSGFIYGITI